MALSGLLMKELCNRLSPGDRIASFGYPDIIAKPKDIEAILGTKIYRLKYRKDSKNIQDWHGVDHKIPDAHSFFELQGASLEVFDVVAHRGGEIIFDLNYEAEFPGNGVYNFVVDPGTIEHCLNIGQAIKTMAGMLKLDGVILHENPFLAGNHGFYGINPTFYADFYGQKGFELLSCNLVQMHGNNRTLMDVPLTSRFRLDKSEELSCFAVAKRTDIQKIIFPMQTKYRASVIKQQQRVSIACD